MSTSASSDFFPAESTSKISHIVKHILTHLLLRWSILWYNTKYNPFVLKLALLSGESVQSSRKILHNGRHARSVFLDAILWAAIQDDLR